MKLQIIENPILRRIIVRNEIDYLKRKKYLFSIYFIVGLPLLVLDQGLKYWARTNGISWEIIPHFFSLQFLANPHMLFGLKITPNLVWLGLILVGASFIIYHYWDWRKKLYGLSFSLFLAGGVSNYIDRLCFGHVIDYIHVHHWPVFNLGDAFLFLGFVCVFVAGLLEKKEKKRYQKIAS